MCLASIVFVVWFLFLRSVDKELIGYYCWRSLWLVLHYIGADGHAQNAVDVQTRRALKKSRVMEIENSDRILRIVVIKI
jgi:hypothetical protein